MSKTGVHRRRSEWGHEETATRDLEYLGAADGGRGAVEGSRVSKGNLVLRP